MTLLSDINKLRTYFLSKDGGIVAGEVTPDETDTHNLGRADKRWDTIYAREIVADTGGGGGEGGDADTVDGYDAAGNPLPSNLLALDPQSIFPISVYPAALLKDGSRALEGSLTVVADATIDGVDISEHIHTGVGDEGAAIAHADTTGLDADDHPQYTQRAQDEIVTGDWMFTHLQDRSAGWQFLPDDKLFKAIPHNMIFYADENEASISLGVYTSSEYAMLIYDDDTPKTYMKIGRGDNSITLHGTDSTYKLWAGAAAAGSAPFHVKNDGSIFATAGDIAGWEIDTTTISKNDMVLNSVGRIIAGDAGEGVGAIIQIDAADPTWRLWIGHNTAASAPFRVNKVGQMYMYDAFVTGTLKSTNFTSGQSGFSLDSSGLAEFQQIIARGRLEATVFAEAAISVASGKMLISDGAVISVDIADTDDFIIVDTDVFQQNDIIRLKPDAYRDEWMRITAPYTIVDEGFKYFVARGLNDTEQTWAGPYDFYAGESVVRLGSAQQTNVGYPLSAGEEGGEFGEFQTGGSGATTGGGYLILEGSRNFGPFFGVSARYGPVYDQIVDVVRIGNLNGVHNYTSEEWGVFFGDANQYFSYDQTVGVIIEFSGTDVDSSIDKSGMKSERFRFAKTSSDPDYANYEALMYYKSVGGNNQVKIRLKEDATETEYVITGLAVKTGIPTPAPNGVITLFTTPGDEPYTANGIMVYIQGVAQKPGTDFNETNPAIGTFTMTTAPETGVSMVIQYAVNTSVDYSLSQTDHGQLIGRDDDDHTLYFLADGTRQLDGDLTFTGPQTIKTTSGGLTLEPFDGDLTVDSPSTNASILSLRSELKTQWGAPAYIDFVGHDAGENDTVYARITALIGDNTESSEDGRLYWGLISGGAMVSPMALRGGGTAGAYLSMYSDVNSDAAEVGGYTFYGKNDAGTPETIGYVGLAAKIIDASDGIEDGELLFNFTDVGAYSTQFKMSGRGLDFLDRGGVPATPASGWGRLYVNADELFFLDDAGDRTQLTGIDSKNITIGNGLEVIEAGDKMYFRLFEATRLERFSLMADVSGNLVVVLKKIAWASYPGSWSTVVTMTLSALQKTTGAAGWDLDASYVYKLEVTGTPATITLCGIELAMRLT